MRRFLLWVAHFRAKMRQISIISQVLSFCQAIFAKKLTKFASQNCAKFILK